MRKAGVQEADALAAAREPQTAGVGVRWAAAPVVLMLVASLSLRLLLLMLAGVDCHGDSYTYIALGQRIAALDLSADMGERTPVYPLLLALCQFSSPLVAIIQMALGTASVYLLSAAVRSRSGSSKLAVLVGLAYGLAVPLALYDVGIITESLATFLCTLAMALYLKAQGSGYRSLMVGVLAGLAALTRPNLIVSGPILAASFLFLAREKVAPRRRWRSAVLCALPFLVLVGAWCAFNQRRFGWFTISTVAGLAMTNVTGDILAEMPADGDPVLSTYAERSTATAATTGTRVNAVWGMRDELAAVAGKPIYQVSRDLLPAHLKAMTRYPLPYLQRLSHSWANFWNVPEGEWPGHPWLWRLSRVQRYALMLLVAAPLLALSGIAALSRTMRVRMGMSGLEMVLMAQVLVCSAASAAADFGNGRYWVPYMPMSLCVLSVAGHSMISRHTRGRRSACPGADDVGGVCGDMPGRNPTV